MKGIDPDLYKRLLAAQFGGMAARDRELREKREKERKGITPLVKERSEYRKDKRKPHYTSRPNNSHKLPKLVKQSKWGRQQQSQWEKKKQEKIEKRKKVKRDKGKK